MGLGLFRNFTFFPSLASLVLPFGDTITCRFSTWRTHSCVPRRLFSTLAFELVSLKNERRDESNRISTRHAPVRATICHRISEQEDSASFALGLKYSIVKRSWKTHCFPVP